MTDTFDENERSETRRVLPSSHMLNPRNFFRETGRTRPFGNPVETRFQAVHFQDQFLQPSSAFPHSRKCFGIITVAGCLLQIIEDSKEAYDVVSIVYQGKEISPYHQRRTVQWSRQRLNFRKEKIDSWYRVIHAPRFERQLTVNFSTVYLTTFPFICATRSMGHSLFLDVRLALTIVSP